MSEVWDKKERLEFIKMLSELRNNFQNTTTSIGDFLNLLNTNLENEEWNAENIHWKEKEV